jgi:hypothetical protein
MTVAAPTSAAGRKSLAAQGQALPGGGYPVPNVAYLKKAIKAKGRTDPSKWPALKSLLLKRARELGAQNAAGVKGTWIYQTSQVYAPGQVTDLAGALPVTSASDGPRMTTAAAGAAAKKIGLPIHQAKAYAKLRSKKVRPKQAMKMARQVGPPANQMGTAKAYSRASVDLASTNQASAKLPQSAGNHNWYAQGGGSPSTNQASALLKQSAGKNSGGRTAKGSQLLRQSAGRGRGSGMANTANVPAVPLNVKTPNLTNLNVKGIQSTYKKLRSRGMAHDMAMNVARRANVSGRGNFSGVLRTVTTGPGTKASI